MKYSKKVTDNGVYNHAWRVKGILYAVESSVSRLGLVLVFCNAYNQK
jgi:hypothetical protein